MLKIVVVIIRIITIIFSIDVFLEPILSIIMPIKIPPITSPQPKLTMPNKAFDS
jgi:hypothetical protein